MRLQPLTIGHLDLLHETKSPFITLQPPLSKRELIKAVAICAQTYPSARDYLHGDAGWLERFRLRMLARKWGVLIIEIQDLEKEFERFWAYLRFHLRYAELKPFKGETRTLGSPERWRLRDMLMQGGMTWDEATEFPMLRAILIWCVRGDREGWLELEPSDSLTRSRLSEFNSWAMDEDRKAFSA